MTHAKISSGVQHRVYILHVLRIKDKQKKLSSKCYEKLSTWLKCHNFFATPWKFLILSNMYWGQTKRFKKWKKTDFVFCNLLLVRLCWIYNFPTFLFFWVYFRAGIKKMVKGYSRIFTQEVEIEVINLFIERWYWMADHNKRSVPLTVRPLTAFCLSWGRAHV